MPKSRRKAQILTPHTYTFMHKAWHMCPPEFELWWTSWKWKLLTNLTRSSSARPEHIGLTSMTLIPLYNLITLFPHPLYSLPIVSIPHTRIKTSIHLLLSHLYHVSSSPPLAAMESFHTLPSHFSSEVNLRGLSIVRLYLLVYNILWPPILKSTIFSLGVLSWICHK